MQTDLNYFTCILATLLILILCLMKITDRIREIRTIKNISQEYLASFLGIDTSSYHRIERGVCPLSVQRLERIAEALQVSIADLILMEKSGLPVDDPQYAYIKHLEEEIRFLRIQLQDKISPSTLSANSLNRTSPALNELQRMSRG